MQLCSVLQRPEWRPAPAAALPTLGPEKGQEEVTPMGGVVKTHQRHLTTLPEVGGSMGGVYNGKIEPGEFSIPYQPMKDS